jgi:adenylyltransferase/sulfurtransferase
MLKYERQTIIEGWDQSKLTNAKVAVVGAGALGNHVTLGLIGLGVGSIRIYDFDTIEAHNLNRQSLFVETDIGAYKAEALERRLKERNSVLYISGNVEKITEDNIDLLLTDVDLVIDAVDNADVRRLLSEFCLTENVPLVHGAISYNGGQVAVLTRETPCISCIYGDAPPKAESCIDVVIPGVVYASQIIAGLVVEQVRKVLNPLPEDSAPVPPLLYYYTNQIDHMKHLPVKRRDACRCREILSEVAPEILEREEARHAQDVEEDRAGIARLLN